MVRATRSAQCDHQNRAVARFGGREVKSIVATASCWSSPVFAGRCDSPRRSSSRSKLQTDPDLRIRMGIHTPAETIIDASGDLFGRHVNLAARVANLAAGGEIMASLVVLEIGRRPRRRHLRANRVRPNSRASPSYRPSTRCTGARTPPASAAVYPVPGVNRPPSAASDGSSSHRHVGFPPQTRFRCVTFDPAAKFHVFATSVEPNEQGLLNGLLSQSGADRESLALCSNLQPVAVTIRMHRAPRLGCRSGCRSPTSCPSAHPGKTARRVARAGVRVSVEHR